VEPNLKKGIGCQEFFWGSGDRTGEKNRTAKVEMGQEGIPLRKTPDQKLQGGGKGPVLKR